MTDERVETGEDHQRRYRLQMAQALVEADMAVGGVLGRAILVDGHDEHVQALTAAAAAWRQASQPALAALLPAPLSANPCG